MKPKYLDQRLACNRCLNFLKFILFCLCWVSVFIAVYGLSLVAASRGYSLVVLHLSRRWLLLLQSTDSRVRASVVSEQWLSFPMAGGLPRPGVEPKSLALAGGFLTIGPPGKSSRCHFLFSQWIGIYWAPTMDQLRLGEVYSWWEGARASQELPKRWVGTCCRAVGKSRPFERWQNLGDEIKFLF